VSVFAGAGDGSFGRAVLTAFSGSHPDMALGDFNGDGVPDYAVANYEGSVSVLVGTPGGGFTASPRIATGAGTVGVLANDFNRDGKTDIVGMSGRRADVTVALSCRAAAGSDASAPPTRRKLGAGVS
jgi:hypothetical protein